MAEHARRDALDCPWQAWLQQIRNDAHSMGEGSDARGQLLQALRLNAEAAQLLAIEGPPAFAKLVGATALAQRMLAELLGLSHRLYDGARWYPQQVANMTKTLLRVRCASKSATTIQALIECHADFHREVRATCRNYGQIQQPGMFTRSPYFGYPVQSTDSATMVTWHGYLLSPTGFGDETRHLVLSLHRAGLNVRAVPVEATPETNN